MQTLASKLLVGGGQEYHGPTAERDKAVVIATAKELFRLVGNTVGIVTGGMPGIPMDFAKAWIETGGRHVEFIFSEEAYNKLTEQDFMSHVTYTVVAKTQKERRQALTQLHGLKCAFFVQGGQYTTDEILKCIERGTMGVVCFAGSGGAAGGKIPYEGKTFKPENKHAWMDIDNPNADVEFLALNFASTIRQEIADRTFNPYEYGLPTFTSFFTGK